MKHIGLFEGIGGFSLAARWMGWETIAWCEWNEFCQKVLSHHFPEAKKHGDITKTDFTIYRGQCDILTGGFPCQKFSVAGSQTGDDRLIKELLRAVDEIKPVWVVAENVGNILNKKFKDYLNLLVTDLENQGYQTPLVFDCTADAIGLPTLERHIWFITQANSQRQKRGIKEAFQDKSILQGEFSRSYQGEYNRWELPSSRVCELGEGVSNGLDTGSISKTKWHGESIQAIGNAINPQVALQIFKAIESYDQTINRARP